MIRCEKCGKLFGIPSNIVIDTREEILFWKAVQSSYIRHVQRCNKSKLISKQK